jgi:hypothetical protein
MSEAAWTFISAGGPRGVYVRYAAEAELPCKLIVNGEVEQRRALFESTLGAPDWRYQTTVELQAGENSIAVRSHGEIPEIEALAVGPPPDGQPLSIDDAFAAVVAAKTGAIPRRPLVIRPAQMRGLVDTARTVVTDPAAYSQLNRIVARLLTATRWDSENGFSRVAWGGGPMNGQRFRQRIFNHLVGLDIDVIVETGTYIGSSTSFFARQGVPVFTCELQEKYLGRAAAHLTEYPNVTMHLDDSRSFLRRLAADPAFRFERPLFYLDAHWEEDLPLAEEIQIITGRWPSFVIMVDDFQVPGTDYVYDSYANGRELTLGYLEREGVPLDDFAVLFPTLSPEAETGARCGTLILMPPELYAQRMSADRTVFRHRTGARP